MPAVLMSLRIRQLKLSLPRTPCSPILWKLFRLPEPWLNLAGVVLTYVNFLANLKPIEKRNRALPALRADFSIPLRFNLLPLSHVFGQMLGIFLSQILGHP